MFIRSHLILERLFVVSRGTEQWQEHVAGEARALSAGGCVSLWCLVLHLIVVLGTGAQLPQLYSAYQALRPWCGQRRGRTGD